MTDGVEAAVLNKIEGDLRGVQHDIREMRKAVGETREALVRLESRSYAEDIRRNAEEIDKLKTSVTMLQHQDIAESATKGVLAWIAKNGGSISFLLIAMALSFRIITGTLDVDTYPGLNAAAASVSRH